MNLRARLVGAVTAVTLVTLGGAFTAVSVTVNRAQERRLDHALHAQCLAEAQELSLEARPTLDLDDRPGPAVNDVGPLTRYGALHDAAGAPVAATPTFRGRAPRLPSPRPAHHVPYDTTHAGERLRAVVVPVPGRAGLALFLAAPRADLDSDEAFLRRAMLLVFGVAVAWSIALASWMAARLTREHEAVTAVLHRVAEGDLSARVAARHDAVGQLGRDVDETVGRLEALVRAQRAFVANAAHELRSPLTTLLGELAHALRKPRDVDAYRDAIEEALDAARRLHQTAEDLLSLARAGAESGDALDDVDVAALLGAVREEFARRAEQADVRLDVHADAARVKGRRLDLLRLLRNLVDNALRLSPRGATLSLRAHLRGDALELSVTDQGPGIPAEERERVFDPFYRAGRGARDDDAGSGLGLAIVREIARAHGGTVAAHEGPEGRGARFVVTLPPILTMS